MPRLPFAAVLLLFGPAPARAALVAQAGESPVVGYGVGIAVTVLVLLVVCWPARRRE